MPYSKGKYPDRIKGLPTHAQDIWVSAFNNAIKSNNEESSDKIAWSAIKKAGYSKDKDGNWNKLSETYYYSNVIKLSDELSDELPDSIEIMRTGKWKHNSYGNFEINDNTINNIITNFNNKVRGIDISFDLEHGTTANKSEAVCWVKKLIKDGSRLMAEVDWTELGKKKIKDKSFKYFSPEFKFKYEDSESGKKYEDVLLGGGLTNRPFIKNMCPIMLSEQMEEEYKNETSNLYYIDTNIKKKKKEDSQMNDKILSNLKLSETATEEEILTAVNKLIEDSNNVESLTTKLNEETEKTKTLTKKVDELTVKLNESMDSKSDAEKENIKLSEEIDKINSRLKLSDWNNLYTVALNEGKMTPAMEETFKTQYMNNPEETKKIIDCLQPIIKLNEDGSARGKDETTHLKLFEDEIRRYQDTKKCDYETALIAVTSEKPELFENVEKERMGVI